MKGLTVSVGMLLLLISSLSAQNLDSLLANKRIYQTLNIGDNDIPRIDGQLDDPVWQLGEWQGAFTQQQPLDGALPTENTYIKVLYNESDLFVSIICQDSQPAGIRDIFDRRDALSGDMTGIALDSYHDRLTAFEFNMSAAGQKMDLKHLGDFQWDFNWNGVWDGATARIDSGWVAEMRIPFSQLRYTSKTQYVWGMHVWRWIDRKAEEDDWQYIPLKAPAMVYLFGELHGLEGIRTSRQVEFLPYVLGSYDYSGEESKGDFTFNGGLDAKVGISSGFTLDLSVNPDFGQVEADPSVLNLTSFETFYEEKRPFFLEGTEIFDFALDQDIPYYSRRIGSEPDFPAQWQGQVVDDLPDRTTILGALKLTGKSRKGLSVGLMNGLTAQEYGTLRRDDGEVDELEVAPLSNYFASRIKQELNDGNTIAGGYISSVNRISADSAARALLPETALTGGLDLLHYWNNKNYFLEFKAIGSMLRGSPEAIFLKQTGQTHRFQRPDASYLEVDSLRDHLVGHGAILRTGKKGGKWNYSIKGEYRSPGLNLNDVGYIRQADFLGEGLKIAYKMNDPKEWIRNYTLTFSHEAQWSFGGENTGNQMGIDLTLRNNKLWTCILSYNYDFSHLDIRELRGGPAIRIDGEHQGALLISSNTAKDLYGQVGLHANNYVEKDSHEALIYTEITWLPVRRIKLSLKPSLIFTRYHQQYVSTLEGSSESLYLVGHLDQQTAALTIRGEFYFTPEMSLQYYGSPFFSVGDYSGYKRVRDGREKDPELRLEELDVVYNEADNSYSFEHNQENWSFTNPDFSFSQFRSNLVFRWEYKLGSTLFLVWSHDHSDWQGRYNKVSEIAGSLFGVPGKNIFMVKLNYWFSL